MKRIDIRGVILPSEYDSDWLDDYVERGCFCLENRVRAAIAEATPSEGIELYINSRGGSVFAGNEIIAALTGYHLRGGKIDVIVGALAASQAAAITLAMQPIAQKIAVHKNTKIMFHGASCYIEGGSQALEDESKLLSDLNNDMIKALVKLAPEIEDEIKSWFDEGREGWINAERAIEIGLATEIISINDNAHAGISKEAAAALAEHDLDVAAFVTDEGEGAVGSGSGSGQSEEQETEDGEGEGAVGSGSGQSEEQESEDGEGEGAVGSGSGQSEGQETEDGEGEGAVGSGSGQSEGQETEDGEGEGAVGSGSGQSEEQETEDGEGEGAVGSGSGQSEEQETEDGEGEGAVGSGSGQSEEQEAEPEIVRLSKLLEVTEVKRRDFQSRVAKLEQQLKDVKAQSAEALAQKDNLIAALESDGKKMKARIESMTLTALKGPSGDCAQSWEDALKECGSYESAVKKYPQLAAAFRARKARS